MVVFFSSRRRHTRYWRDWSSDVCSSDLRRRSAPPGQCRFCRPAFARGRYRCARLAHGCAARHGRGAMSIAATSKAFAAGETRRSISDFWFRYPWFFFALLLIPPLLWIGVVYVGSLIALLLNSFYSLDDF